MEPRWTPDGRAYYDEETGAEIAVYPPNPIYPSNPLTQIFALIRWKLTGEDPSDPFPRPPGAHASSHGHGHDG